MEIVLEKLKLSAAAQFSRYTASIFIGLNFFDFDREKPSRLFQLAQLNLWIRAIGVLHLESETG